jgi:putative DNA-invertase from lambdoid prophage Rac
MRYALIMSTSRRIAIYLRVSTREQSTETQRGELLTYVASRGWNQFTIYEDKATGTNTNRAQLKALMEDIRAGKIDIVLVWKLDRFARSLSDLIRMLTELRELNVDFISLRDQLDLTTSAGKLMLHILGAFANFEADIIKERVIAGVANAKAKGTRFGRPSTIDPLKVYELRSKGWSLGKIAKYLSVSKAGVHKVLSQNPYTNTVNNIEITRMKKSIT